MFEWALVFGTFWITHRVARRYSRLSPLWGVHAVVLSVLIGSICLSLLKLLFDLPFDSPTWELAAVAPFWLALVPGTLGMVVSVVIVGIVVSLVSQRPDEGMVQWAGRPVWGERYWIHACLAFGYTVGVFFLSASGDPPNPWGGLLTIALGSSVGRLALLERRRKAATARRTKDARPPVLLLRGFDSTRQDPHRRTGEESAGLALFMGRPSFEERLAGAVDRHLGPLRSLGDPADFLPELGGTRHYVANSAWQETVADEMARAQRVLVMEGASPGLRWEWEYILRNVPAPKVFLLTYPDKHLGRNEWVGTVAMLNEIGIGLPSRDPRGRSAYRFSEGWKAELLLAGGRDEDRVAEAVRPSGVLVKSEDSRSPLPRGRLASLARRPSVWLTVAVVVSLVAILVNAVLDAPLTPPPAKTNDAAIQPAPSTGADPNLNDAVVAHDLTRLQNLLSVQRSQEELDSALTAAAGTGNIDAARLLLATGANPNSMLSLAGFTTTPVIVAVRENQPDVLKVLLENGANPNLANTFDWKPLHHAISEQYARIETVELLIRYGADVNAMDSLLRTPLHRSAMFGHTEAARLLLSAGADASLREKYGNTAADRAAEAGYDDLAGALRAAE